MQKSERMLSLISPILILIIDIYILYNMFLIQKDTYVCKCANTDYVKKISRKIEITVGAQLIIAFILIFVNIDININKNNSFILLSSIPILLTSIVQIYYLSLLINYIDDLKIHNCFCVDKKLTNLLFYYSYGRLLALFYMFITFIIDLYITQFS
jgi:hypothetical protein